MADRGRVGGLLNRTIATLVVLAACSATPPANAVRPQRRGQAAVLLVASGQGYLPLACHDPLWDTLRGAADCADLVPPGAQLQTASGPVTIQDRAPVDCAWSAGVRLTTRGKASGFAFWPSDTGLHLETPPTTPLPAPPPWPQHTRGGWRADLPSGPLWTLDLGGFSGLFYGDPPVIIDHFVDTPRLAGLIDLDADGQPEVLLEIGAPWAVYRIAGGRLEGVGGCVL